MRRREFLQATVMAGAASSLPAWRTTTVQGQTTHEPSTGAASECCDRTYATPSAAMQSPRETLLYIPGIYAGTEIDEPDYLATVDVDPTSPDYGRVVHRLPMPNVGDELHHFGWNACSSCHGDTHRQRRFIVLPGIASGRIHFVDTSNPRAPRLHSVLESAEIADKVNLSAPHTIHCLASGEIMVSMLGDADGNGPGGFLLLDDQFRIAGRWERDRGDMQFNYDFWYQPRHNVMVSSEWAAPKTFRAGFDPADVPLGKFGRRLHFWDWKDRTNKQTIDLGESGLIPLEVRFHHDPDSPHGFVGAALSSTMWHFYPGKNGWTADKVIEVASVPKDGWPFPVPGLITDLVLSMDDRWLYFSNWLHGDIRQYDVSDPAHPKLTGQLWLGGVLGREVEASVRDRKPSGGPQMLQLSLDGKRLYVSNSLYSAWDNQFYPDIQERGSYLLRVECDPERGGMRVADDFYVDFGKEPAGPARAHEMRFPGGDSTSDIWV